MYAKGMSNVMKLQINDISKSYGTNKALSDFTATFESGIYALLGPLRLTQPFIY